MGTLKNFLRGHKLTLERAAFLVNVQPNLLLRIDQGRQPLPLTVIQRLAALTNEAEGTVKVAAGSFVDSLDATYLIPKPPIPLLGDKF